LIADVVHTSLNPRGGSERVAIATIRALLETDDWDVRLNTYDQPDLPKLAASYGQSVVALLQRVKSIVILQSIEKQNLSRPSDLTINTHGDLLPFFHHNMTKTNSIVYCHFPLAKYLIDGGFPEYFGLIHHSHILQRSEAVRTRFLAVAKNNYIQMIRNSTVLTNSEYSRRAIWKTFGTDSTVLSPPVEVERFRSAVWLSRSSKQHANTILVISRLHHTKKIENAIRLANLLKKNKIAEGITIVGNVSPDGLQYYSHLKQKVKEYNLGKYVKFEINTNFEKLIDVMRRSKVYLHPLPGEPFGISVVEAMSAGLIPVVPDIGGYTEFVPSKYQYHTFGGAVEAISNAIEAPYSERNQLSESMRKFSVSNYIQSFQKIVSRLSEQTRVVKNKAT
jgi:glycosyltransferase involved in cell wall biosynthesis